MSSRPFSRLTVKLIFECGYKIPYNGQSACKDIEYVVISLPCTKKHLDDIPHQNLIFIVNFLQHATLASQVYTYETNRTKLNRYVGLDYQAEGN